MRQIDITLEERSPTPLLEEDGHAIYWIGNVEPTLFRTNTYLICDGDEALLVDPGNRSLFGRMKERVAQILSPEQVTGLIVCHQDPDVAASMVDWLWVNPEMKVYTSARTNVLLPHYGCSDYQFVDIEKEPELHLPSGARLNFITAPFLHFPGAFATYDAASGALLSGDIFASLQTNTELWANDFEALRSSMELFHIHYMAGNAATRGFVRKLLPYSVDYILPQHGNLIGPELVAQSLGWLRELRCGLDLIYPE